MSAFATASPAGTVNGRQYMKFESIVGAVPMMNCTGMSLRVRVRLAFDNDREKAATLVANSIHPASAVRLLGDVYLDLDGGLMQGPQVIVDGKEPDGTRLTRYFTTEKNWKGAIRAVQEYLSALRKEAGK